MKKTYSIPSQQLSSILTEFANLTANNPLVKKVDYELWRTLVRASQSNKTVDIQVEYSTLLQEYELTISNSKSFFTDNIVFIEMLTKTEKENNTMMENMNKMQLEFGPVRDNIAISPYGLAVRKAETWLTYDAKNGQTVDVTGFTFKANNMIYKMPAAINSIAAGDMILHQGKPMYVVRVDGSHVEAIDILSSEAKTIIPVTNMFGFNFVTKVVTFINLGNATPSADQPFGNLMPMMMASMFFGNDEGNSLFDGDMDITKMMVMSAIFGGENPFASLFSFNSNQR